MSYNPTTWKAGDTVTVSKLNKIEQGIVNAEKTGSSDNGPLVVTFSNTNNRVEAMFTADVLATDITAALQAKRPVLMYFYAELQGETTIENFTYSWDVVNNKFKAITTSTILEIFLGCSPTWDNGDYPTISFTDTQEETGGG